RNYLGRQLPDDRHYLHKIRSECPRWRLWDNRQVSDPTHERPAKCNDRNLDHSPRRQTRHHHNQRPRRRNTRGSDNRQEPNNASPRPIRSGIYLRHKLYCPAYPTQGRRAHTSNNRWCTIRCHIDHGQRESEPQHSASAGVSYSTDYSSAESSDNWKFRNLLGDSWFAHSSRNTSRAEHGVDPEHKSGLNADCWFYAVH